MKMCFPAVARSDFNPAGPADPSNASIKLQKIPKSLRRVYKKLQKIPISLEKFQEAT
jgi:hypothetical protein